MKILLPLLICISISCVAQETDKSLAKVEQRQGIYIFTDCVPVAQYEYLSTVKKTNWSGVYDKLISGVIKNAKQECPQVEALIIQWKPNGTIQADCIRFK